MLLLGCRPKGRHTEQHDVFFSIGDSLAELVPSINNFWPEVKGNIHIDAWREVTYVEGYEIAIVPRTEQKPGSGLNLYFMNLGGYKEDEFEEYHYKILIVAQNPEQAKQKVKETLFYRHTGFKGAVAHIDDKYGVDIDDLLDIQDILPISVKEKYTLHISPTVSDSKDLQHLGYLPLFRIAK
jgi:hypothetical protein